MSLDLTNVSRTHGTVIYLHTHNDQTVLFQTIQFCISYLFALFKCLTVLFDPKIETYQMLLLRVRADLGVMAMKRYSIFLKAPTLHELNHQIVQCHIPNTRSVGGVPYPSALTQSVYSIAPADWAIWCYCANILPGPSPLSQPPEPAHGRLIVLWFLSSPARSTSHCFMNTQDATYSKWQVKKNEQTSKHRRGLAPSERREKVCDTFM